MLPEDRQTMLFSATMPDPIVTLSRKFLRTPVTVHAGHTTEPGVSPQTKQVVYRTHQLNKLELLARILQAQGRGLTMIFTRTKRPPTARRGPRPWLRGAGTTTSARAPGAGAAGVP
jgi:superfamily II DNA/RNA helicase